MAGNPLASPVRVFPNVGDQPSPYRVGDDVPRLYPQVLVIAQTMIVEAALPDRSRNPSNRVDGPRATRLEATKAGRKIILVQGKQPMQMVRHDHPCMGLADAFPIAVVQLVVYDIGQRGRLEQWLPVMRGHGHGIHRILPGMTPSRESWAGHAASVRAGDGDVHRRLPHVASVKSLRALQTVEFVERGLPRWGIAGKASCGASPTPT